ncbi:MAG: type I DNA topoisomerase [Lachnospiraceae bacterium]|nr:type I DNA topoisomerase [Lachnospiraceae bacterium]
MAKCLVIVESPAKVKTIKKFLGSNYEVAASNGHVRDLPKSQMGIDLENDYEPKYITIRGKGELLASLRKLAKKADKIYLATDPDREGEAISWHLSAALGLDREENAGRTSRITFNEITKSAVKESLRHPREIDMNLVDAQQARRVLDRMVGYRISPLLWAKVKRGLSAGRVQSVALRMIGDREDEINAFIPEEYWTMDAELSAPGDKKPLTAHYYGLKKQGKKAEIRTEEEAGSIARDLDGAVYRVDSVKTSERIRRSPLPFTTSTLQQEASSTLNFSTQKTMRIAQQLYEGVDIKGSGTIGIITYLRTDSTRVSDEAEASAAAYISEKYGNKYLHEPNTAAKSGKKIQDAHEAIRPTDISRTPAEIKDSLTRDQYRLYQLIWRRFAASRMAPARSMSTQIRIAAKGIKEEHIFTLSASKPVFDGFLAVYSDEEDPEAAGFVSLGRIPEEGDELRFLDLHFDQHFTQSAPHYTEATLVRAMEEQGIGRPSTYAPTITTILARRYIVKEDKNLYLTELGEVVNNMMKNAFPTIVDLNFTANLESLLDGVAEGSVKWKTVIENFYPDLDSAVKKAEKELAEVRLADEETDVVCENCGRKMVIKYGQHGKFLACPGFPECRNTLPYYESIGVACPKCGRDIVVKKTRKGRRYYGCAGNPECDFMSWQKPSAKKCPQCGGMMLEKGRKLVCMDQECGYVEDRDE